MDRPVARVLILAVCLLARGADAPAQESKPPSAPEPDPRVSDEELAVLIQEIDPAQDVLLGRISGMTDEQWAFRENPDRPQQERRGQPVQSAL